MQKIIFFLICFFTISGTIANAKTGNNPSEKPAKKQSFVLYQKTEYDTANIKSMITYLEGLLKSSMKFEIYINNQPIANKPAKPKIDSAVVSSIFHQSMFKEQHDMVAIGFENYFVIENFKKFKSTYLDSTSDKSKLVLFVNGKAFPQIPIRLFDESKKNISFFWNRNDSLTKIFFQSNITKFKFRIKNATIGFGYLDTTNKKWVEVGKKQVDMLYVIKRYAIVTVVIWFLFLVFFACYLGKKTNLIREGKSMENRYSLSLTQFAFWTVIIFTAYFYLWIVTFELVKVPDSTLALLGITTLTAAGSKLTDIRKTSKSIKKSESFLTDLLSEDEVGLSVNRCQMFLVTLLFGVIYLINVFSQQAIPDFNNSLLWLIGISSGAFVGIKSVDRTVQESKSVIKKNKIK